MLLVVIHELSLVNIGSAFAAGFVTSLTPCVYPMLPVVIGYLGNLCGSRTQRMAAAALYALGLASVYATLGVVAGLSGSMFGGMTQNAYVHLGFGAVVLYCSGVMMGWYTFPGWLSRVQVARGASPRSYLAAFSLGAGSGLVAAPCSAPVLAGLLVYTAAQQDPIGGALMLLSFALGMSLLLLIVGLSANLMRFLPKSDRWMLGMQRVMALCLLCGGLYFVFRAGQLY